MCRHISNEGTCSSGRRYYRDVETETASVSIRVGFRVTPGGLCQVLEAKICLCSVKVAYTWLQHVRQACFGGKT